VVVGVNRFVEEHEPTPEILHIPAQAEQEQVERLRHMKQNCNSNAVEACLTKLKDAARTEKAPLMEPIIEAVEANGTIGEISNALRDVWGEYRGK